MLTKILEYLKPGFDGADREGEYNTIADVKFAYKTSVS